MNYDRIVFYNHWHYGDLFSTRGLIKDFRKFFPDAKFGYAFTKNRYPVRDLIDYELQDWYNSSVFTNLTMHHPVAYDESIGALLVNTWVGVYEGSWQGHPHPSYAEHLQVYQAMYNFLNQQHEFNLTVNPDVWYYVPEIDYSYYNTKPADQIINQTIKRVLICNNDVQSQQSSVGDLSNVINSLAAEYPLYTFLVTNKISTGQRNVYFTSDIFQQANDLCEISYLSQFCDVIVGKNSSPHTYTLTRQNLQNSHQTNICLSHNAVDCLPYGLDYKFNYIFSNATDEQTIRNIIASNL